MGAVPLKVPLEGPETMAKVRVSPSGSLAVRVSAKETSSSVTKLCGFAVGASLIGVMVKEMVAEAEERSPSLTEKVNESDPV